MPFEAEPDVNSYGYLVGGDDLLTVDAADHHWAEPYPPIERPVRFRWEPGDLGTRPNLFRHNLLRDVVCDETALRVLREAAEPGDLHVIATGSLDDGTRLTVVQATTVLDVVDEERSIPSQYSWARIQFPHIREDQREATRRRVFRVPYRELTTMVLVGDEVKAAVEKAGLRGWVFTPAQVDG